MEHKEFFDKLKNRTTMFIPEKTYNCMVSFLYGYDTALKGEIFKGFREWLTYKYGAPNNLAFFSQIEFLLFGYDYQKIKSELEELQAIDLIFKLYDEFETDKKEIGLEMIYSEHEKFMRKELGE